MEEYFVGYDTKHNDKGHTKRVRILNAGVVHYARKYEDHLYLQGKPGHQPGLLLKNLTRGQDQRRGTQRVRVLVWTLGNMV